MSSNLIKRISSGVPLVLLGGGYIYLAAQYVFIAVSAVILLVCLWEYTRAIQKKFSINQFSVYLSCLLFFAGLIGFWNNQLSIAISLFSVVCLLILVSVLISKERSFQLLGWYCLPLPWICLPIFLLTPLRFSYIDHTGANLIFLIIVIAAVNDTCAYFGGTKFGKHKLAPKISPNKSIEGSVFGFAGGIIAAYIYLWALIPDYVTHPLTLIVVLAVIAASQLGDLFESLIKRHYGIKDSSNIIPGHGGVLDRFDSYLFAIPVFLGLRHLLLV